MNLSKRREEPYCLVLSGGGAKGVYHIGAWRALKELGIEVNAFIGNSIGAIIAGFLAQGNEEKLYFIGDNINVDYLIKIPEELSNNGELKVSLKHLSSFRNFYKKAFLGGGIDTSPLRALLNESLDENLIRKSGNDLGVVTFNISDMRAKEVFLEQMEEGTVIEYLMASSAFPGFNRAVIKGQKYIDGGVYDNIPYKLARLRGYRKIITIDISGLGVNKHPNIEGSETIYIKNSINMGGVLDFNRKFLDQFMELGYLDTMRTFGELKGLCYFILADKKMEKTFSHLMHDTKTLAILSEYINHKKGSPASVDLGIRSILPHNMRHQRADLFYCLVECCAVIFRLEKIHKYTISEIISLIVERKMETERQLHFLDNVHCKSESRKLIKKINIILRKTNSRETLKDTPYHNSLLADKILYGKTGEVLKMSLHKLYPELNAALFFLDFLDSFPQLT